MPITYRLKTGVAQLLRDDVSSRKEIASEIADLYGARSAIVHGGRYEVQPDELSAIRVYAKNAILTILNKEQFTSTKDEATLDEWFEDRILGLDAA